MTSSDIQNMFTYHAPTPSQVQRYQSIREAAKHLGFTILNACPESREKETAIILLQQAVMMANASIAVNEKDAAEIQKEIFAKTQSITERLQALKKLAESDPDLDLNQSTDAYALGKLFISQTNLQDKNYGLASIDPEPVK